MFSLRKVFTFTILAAIVVLITAAFELNLIHQSNPHFAEGSGWFGSGLDSLHEGFNGLFASSGKCDNCHGFDPDGIASVDLEGGDINVVDDWRSTMMANSAKDPFWRAKVSHEVLLNPVHQIALENKCTSCHSPLGHFAAFFGGASSFSIEDMLADSVALDGVSCLACHQQSTEQLGNTHSGNLHFVDTQTAFGPFENPLITPMALASGYTPEWSTHINDAGICAGCHTLVTETIGLDGNFSGGSFVEQATYHEWLNSSYSTGNITCQHCHIPRLENQPVQISAGFDTPPREPFGLHTLAGANTFMLKLMKNNMDALGISADEEDFDQTIAATFDMLQNKSLDLEIEIEDRTADSVFVNVKLTNKAGHKLPSGYPSRKMSVHFKLQDEDGNELFHSGKFSDQMNYYLENEDEPFEPHYNTITSPMQVQVYEMVMGDNGGGETTVLARGATHLKDNRLVPAGFSIAHEVYDTTLIVGSALEDPDFNHDPLEGSGTDVIHYRIPLNGFDDEISGLVEVYYQSLPPTWMEEIFSSTTSEIEFFGSLFNDADKTPVLMQSESFVVEPYTGIVQVQQNTWGKILQNENGFAIHTSQPVKYILFDAAGKLLASDALRTQDTRQFALSPGAYMLLVEGVILEKIVVR